MDIISWSLKTFLRVLPLDVHIRMTCTLDLTLENPRHVLTLGKKLNCFYNGYYRLTKHKNITNFCLFR